MAISSSCFSTVYALSKHSFPSFSLHFSLCSVRRRGAPRRYKVSANLGGGEGGFNKGGKKKFITREEEPDQGKRRRESDEDASALYRPLRNGNTICDLGHCFCKWLD
ncbi:unnamed protein product [Cuscuta epithymum]|uniref:Uncharacterized protein n=1 Tax=Cuscuta epithymum TaxID=186058 RepID=A0AAV0DJZ9_9ASTE|nr:unnamed protein product [Cuscuta epithymum]